MLTPFRAPAFLALILLISLLNSSSSFAQVFIPHTFWSCGQSDYDSKTINTSADFSLGTFSNTNVSGNSVQLSIGQVTGTYTSPVLDIYGGCGALQSWTRFEWKTPLPYGKELPPSSEIATDYSGIAASLMTGAAQLFKMNGSGAIASGTTITASIGSNGTASNSNGAGMTYLAAGKLNSAITFDGTDDRIDIPYTQTNVSDYSVSAWFRTNTAGNGVILQDRGPTGAGNSITLGIGNNPGGCAAGRISYGLDSNTIYIGQCTTGTYNDNAWHHVVGVWNGTSGVAVASNQFTIYVDGAAVSSTATSVGTAPTAPISGLGNTKLGRHDAWAVNYAGSLDEIGIWTRPLSATEVQQIYRRGGNNVRFQIKTCDNSNCSDIATWKGPDNTAATYFTELNNNTVQNTGLGTVLTTFPSMVFANFPSLSVATKRYFQYQATLSSDNSTYQPSFEYVKIYHGCAASTVSFTSNGTFTLPKLCTQMTITATGGGGATGDRNGGGTRTAGGSGGNVIKTFTGLTPLTQYTVSVGTGGICNVTAGTGGYNGGDGGAITGAGVDGAGTLAYGGAGTAGSGNGLFGGDGAFGGGGGGGAGSGGAVAAGGGGASTVTTTVGGTILVIAGGGGGSGGVQNGTAGSGGSACSGAASGDYTRGSNGGTASGTRAGGGGGGGACYCLGGCSTVNSSGGAGGNTVGNSCGASNNGTSGTVVIQYQ
ncbi:MAG: hypothetical protein K0R29_802 [Pseudobdellovibrio sp.]|nr:hypothetical protein [Pseudobdellovibrio sp.]